MSRSPVDEADEPTGPPGKKPGTVAELAGLTRVFTPTQAAAVLRDIGLEDITECALRTRAYRKQIPFHLNGHRIIFTAEDLREIAEGKACRPRDLAQESPQAAPARARPPRRTPRRDQSPGSSDAWRARRSRDG